MEKHIQQRMEQVHTALAKHWGEKFLLSIYKSNGTKEEVQTSIDTHIGNIYLYIGKDYVHLLHQPIFDRKWDFQFANELNAFTVGAKYILDKEGFIRAEKRIQTSEKWSESIGRALVANVRQFHDEINRIKTAQANNQKRRDV